MTSLTHRQELGQTLVYSVGHVLWSMGLQRVRHDLVTEQQQISGKALHVHRAEDLTPLRCQYSPVEPWILCNSFQNSK